jgi:hypothetical protein
MSAARVEPAAQVKLSKVATNKAMRVFMSVLLEKLFS